MSETLAKFKERVRKMQNDTRIGLEIQNINNGYLVTGHKTNGYMGADTGKNYFATFEEVADALVGIVRQSFDLNIQPEEEDFGFPGGLMIGGGPLN